MTFFNLKVYVKKRAVSFSGDGFFLVGLHIVKKGKTIEMEVLKCLFLQLFSYL